MSKIIAILVGVSNYYIQDDIDLPFCVNDIFAMKNALINGLKVEANNIIMCGENGDVCESNFISTLGKAMASIGENDTLIFYFSGHGTTIDNEHYLVLSDKLIGTQDVLAFLKNIQSKSKIIFLDCCLSGNYKVENSATLNIEKTVEEFHGSGYAVLSSSNAIQNSYGHPDKPMSVFTSFLCDAIQDKYMIREGRKSLYDIKKLVTLYLDVWSRKNPDKPQFPIYRANMGGTIFFEIQNYVPYIPTDAFKEYDDYIIYEVEASHNVNVKRYAVKAILKEPFSLEEIANISELIAKDVKSIEVYNNSTSEKRFSGRPANIIWVYFCRSESDINQGNYICHTTWVDDSQDKDWWYQVDTQNKMFIKNVHFSIQPYYEYLRSFIVDNTGERDALISETKDILANMVTLAEKVIYLFNEYRNGIINEDELVDKLVPTLSEIDKFYFKSTELDIADDSIHDWDDACTILFATIHNFTLYYSRKYLLSRTTENRIACMEMTIKQYYSDLSKVSELEKQLVIQ